MDFQPDRAEGGEFWKETLLSRVSPQLLLKEDKRVEGSVKSTKVGTGRLRFQTRSTAAELAGESVRCMNFRYDN
jgi:hypothetical protein